MRHEVIVHPRTAVISRLPEEWQAPVIRLATAWAVLIVLFLPSWAEMAHQWWHISTYSHVLLVPPILVWLVCLRAPMLARIEPQGWWPGLIPLSGALLLWLVGDAWGINLVCHAAAVAMLASAVLLLLGPRVFAGLLFPVCYMVFLVPFGDELVPFLQDVTAKLCVTFAHWSGIPATLDGIFIDTPAGRFEVAEACSGVKFLIAMVALGALVAHLGYRSWVRRALFMLFAVVLPVLANGVRAWGTVYVGQVWGIEYAGGFDHLVYGWIFFAVVMTVALGLGWLFFDRPADDPFVDPARLNDSAFLGIMDSFTGRGWAVLGMFGLIVLATVGWSAAARQINRPEPLRIDLQDARGWGEITAEPQVSQDVQQPPAVDSAAEEAAERMDREA